MVLNILHWSALLGDSMFRILHWRALLSKFPKKKKILFSLHIWENNKVERMKRSWVPWGWWSPKLSNIPSRKGFLIFSCIYLYVGKRPYIPFYNRVSPMTIRGKFGKNDPLVETFSGLSESLRDFRSLKISMLNLGIGQIQKDHGHPWWDPHTPTI